LRDTEENGNFLHNREGTFQILSDTRNRENGNFRSKTYSLGIRECHDSYGFQRFLGFRIYIVEDGVKAWISTDQST